MSSVQTIKFEFEPGELPVIIKALGAYEPDNMDEQEAVDWLLDELRKIDASSPADMQ